MSISACEVRVHRVSPFPAKNDASFQGDGKGSIIMAYNRLSSRHRRDIASFWLSVLGYVLLALFISVPLVIACFATTALSR